MLHNVGSTSSANTAVTSACGPTHKNQVHSPVSAALTNVGNAASASRTNEPPFTQQVRELVKKMQGIPQIRLYIQVDRELAINTIEDTYPGKYTLKAITDAIGEIERKTTISAASIAGAASPTSGRNLSSKQMRVTAPRIDEPKLPTDPNKEIARKEGVAKVWGSNIGAEYINGLCRQHMGTLRHGTKLEKPTLGAVRQFYKNSDGDSHLNRFPDTAASNVKEVLNLDAPEIVGLLNKTLTKRASMAIYHRGASLPPNEIQYFQQALREKLPVKSSFFMAVTSSKKEAKPFAEGKYDATSGGEPVMFTVIGAPFDIQGSYEREYLFKPGTLFDVTEVSRSRGTTNISLTVSDAKSSQTIVV